VQSNAASRGMATIQVPIREAINMAIDEEMARDEKVFIIGECPRYTRRCLELFHKNRWCYVRRGGCTVPGSVQGDQGIVAEVRIQACH
jgi:hypothetical protein